MMKKLLIICFSGLISGALLGQTTNLGEPTSWNGKLLGINSFNSHTMTGFDRAAVDAQDAIHDAAKDAPWQFGYKYNTDFNL